MKKNTLFLIFVLAALILSACGSAPQTAASTGGTQPAASTSCLGSAEKAVVDLNCRTVRIAVENVYLPFNYVSIKTGQPGGWDYDTFNEICTRLHCTPVFVETAWEGLIQSVAQGQNDIGADGITITDERAKTVDFSNGYLKIQQRLLVRKGETRFNNLESFQADPSLILGAQSNTTNYETAADLLPETRIKAFEQMPFVVQSLISGDLDAVMIDEVAGQGYLGENADKLEFMGDPITSQDLGFAFEKGSDLLAPVNQALEAMRADGTLAALNDKYFGGSFSVTEEDIKTGD